LPCASKTKPATGDPPFAPPVNVCSTLKLCAAIDVTVLGSSSKEVKRKGKPILRGHMPKAQLISDTIQFS